MTLERTSKHSTLLKLVESILDKNDHATSLVCQAFKPLIENGQNVEF